MRPQLDFYDIPIFIISYNRVSDLKKMVDILLKDGYTNLSIIDNNSTAEEVQEYLKGIHDSRVKVFFLNKNYGHRVLWDSHRFDDVIKKQYYVLTDPDIFPVEGCPSNYVEVFYDILQKYPQKTKVGFSLRIDDLPDEYPYKYDIIRYESFYWEKRLPYKFRIYDAPIDTTFALYRPGVIKKNHFYDGIRTGDKFMARHQGWYALPTEQENGYLSGENISSTSINPKSISEFQQVIIHRIIEKERPDFLSMMRLVVVNSELQQHYTFYQIVKVFAYVLVKKVLLMLRLI